MKLKNSNRGYLILMGVGYAYLNKLLKLVISGLY